MKVLEKFPDFLWSSCSSIFLLYNAHQIVELSQGQILSCDKAVHLAYGRSAVLPRCPLVTDIMPIEAPWVFLHHDNCMWSYNLICWVQYCIPNSPVSQSMVLFCLAFVCIRMVNILWNKLTYILFHLVLQSHRGQKIYLCCLMCLSFRKRNLERLNVIRLNTLVILFSDGTFQKDEIGCFLRIAAFIIDKEIVENSMFDWFWAMVFRVKARIRDVYNLWIAVSS